ncbi:MAG: lamin tail domain-containing protein, partial [Bacteroidota bacterium]
MEGTGFDNEFTASAFMGFLFRFTSGNTANFYADDVYAGPVIVDNSAPRVDQVTVVNATKVQVVFDEPLDAVSAVENQHYSIDKGIGNAIGATLLNNRTVELTLFSSLQNKTSYTLTVDGVKDQSGNTQVGLNTAFQYVVTEQYDLLISEFLADPTPVVGLPEYEFIELYNRSGFPINLNGFTLSDGSGAASLPSYVLQPDRFLILCPSSAAFMFQPFGKSLGLTNFPSLNNSSDEISIRNQHNQVIHQLKYDMSWYTDNSKSDGGWSIELINPFDYCKQQNNYAAAVNATGGTPGIKNSQWNTQPDSQAPLVSAVSAISENQLQIDFSERMDSLSALNISF